jgi:hypothetical protein
MHPEVEHLRKLPIAEKLRVVEELWDEIGQSDEPFPLPEWHRVERGDGDGATVTNACPCGLEMVC